jgi:cell division protein FtsB
VILLAAIVVGYLLYATVDDILLSRRLNREEYGLRQEIVELRAEQAQLEAISDFLRTDEYVEGVARRLLGLVRPGETLVVVSSSAPTPTPEQEAAGGESRSWWENLYGP